MQPVTEHIVVDIRDELPSNTYQAKGRALKSYRQRAKLTLKELALKAGVSYTQISRIENGTSKSPRWDTLERLAEALSRDVDDLVIYEDISDVLSEENVEMLTDKRQEHSERHQERKETHDSEGARKGSGDGTGDRVL